MINRDLQPCGWISGIMLSAKANLKGPQTDEAQVHILGVTKLKGGTDEQSPETVDGHWGGATPQCDKHF